MQKEDLAYFPFDSSQPMTNLANNSSQSNPLFHKWLINLGVCTILGVFFSSQTYLIHKYVLHPDGPPPSWKMSLVCALLDWYVWALFIPVILYLAQRYPIERKNWLTRVLMFHLPISFFTSFAHLGIGIGMLFLVGPLAGYDLRSYADSFTRNFVLQFHWNVLTYGLIIGMNFFREQELLKVSAEQAKLKIKLLESHIEQAELKIGLLESHIEQAELKVELLAESKEQAESKEKLLEQQYQIIADLKQQLQNFEHQLQDLVKLQTGQKYLKRMEIQHGKGTFLLEVKDIDWIEGINNSLKNEVELHVGTKSYFRRVTLSKLEAELNPAVFKRIHRSTIINIERVQEIRHAERKIVLKDKTVLTFSKTYQSRLNNLGQISDQTAATLDED